jgi:VWFA-related protein
MAMVKTKILALLAGAFFLGNAVLALSGNSHVYHENAEVSLVEVPVNVFGRDGKPVRGLTAEDFVLKDDGRPQKILSVDIFDLARRRSVSGLPEDLPSAARRHFLLLFDFSFATPNEIVRSRQASLRFVSSAMEPDDLAAVGTASVEQGTRLLVNFTSDRRQLAAAIRSVGLPQVVDQARDPLAFAFVLPGDPFAAKVVPVEEFREGNASEFAASSKIFSMMAQQTADHFSEGRVERQLIGMGSLGQALDAVEGRKHVVYFSEGFDGRLLYGNMLRKSEENIADNNAMMAGQIWTVDLDRRYSNSSLGGRLNEAMELFRRSDCTIYPIDIAGLRDEGDANFGPVSYGRESLFAIASATGGEVIENSNDIDKQIRRILDRTSITYVLSFQPSHSEPDKQKFHNLAVSVRAPHARVSARSGYFETRGFAAMSPLERVLSTADLIVSERSPGTIPFRVAALPLAGDSVDPVPVLVAVPAKFFTSLSGQNQISLAIYAYVSQPDGTLADYFTRTVLVDLAQHSAALASGGLNYLSLCHLVPGSYVLRVLVRDEHSGRYGFLSQPLRVPDFEESGFEVLSPVFLDALAGGLNLRDSGSDPILPGLFAIGGEKYVPKLYPDVSLNSHIRICLIIHRKSSVLEGAPFQMEAECLDAENGKFPARVKLLGRTPPDANGMIKLLLDLDTTGLAAGSYSIRFTLHPGQNQEAVRTEASFRVS